MTQEVNQRKAFDEAIAAMSLAASPYFKEYYFYLHLISQCKVEFNPTLSAPAGVSLHKNKYTLHLNPTEVLGTVLDGTPWRGFCEAMPLVHRLGVLKHEMSHVCLGHLIGANDLSEQEFKKLNYATDCALNQRIDRDHLPKGVIYPDNFPTKEKNVLTYQNNEYYLSIIDLDCKKESASQESGSGNDSGDSVQGNISDGMVGDHSKWGESDGDADSQREATKNMVEKAGEATYKAIGSYPSEYLKILDNLRSKNDVKWEQYIKRVLGARKAQKRKTLLRKNRRLPKCNWVKGVTKDRVNDIAVISDVSGSVSDKSLRALWERILDICDTFKSPVTLVQVDVEPSDPESLSKSTKTVTRKANGGTNLHPALDKLKEFNIKYSVLIITTDGYLSPDDIAEFSKLKVPVVWLIEPNGQILPQMTSGNMKAVKLEDF